MQPQQSDLPRKPQPRVADKPVAAVAGYVRVVVNPWADIWIDGKKVGTTPLAKPLELPEGRHHLEVKNEHFMPDARDITVERGNNATIRVTLKPRVATRP